MSLGALFSNPWFCLQEGSLIHVKMAWKNFRFSSIQNLTRRSDPRENERRLLMVTVQNRVLVILIHRSQMGRLMWTSVTWSVSKLCCALISSSVQWNCWEDEISLTQILDCVLHTGTKCPSPLFENEQTLIPDDLSSPRAPQCSLPWPALKKGQKSLLLPQTRENEEATTWAHAAGF